MAKRTNDHNREYFEVIHPLDDEPEQKLSYRSVGLMRMTPTVRVSLTVLRIYLVLMIALVFYRVLLQAGLFGGLQH